MNTQNQGVTRSPHENAFMNTIAVLGLIVGTLATLFTTATSGMYLWDVMTEDGVQGIDVLITGATTLILASAIFTLTYVGFKVLPTMVRRKKYGTVGAFFAIFAVVISVSYSSTTLAVATPAAQAAYLQRAMEDALEITAAKAQAFNNLRAKAPVVSNKRVTLEELVADEICCGGASGSSGNGKTASLIRGMIAALKEADRELISMDGAVSSINRRLSALEDQITALGQSDQSYAQKADELERLLNELTIVSDDLSENLNTDMIANTSDAISLNFRAIGLTDQAVEVLTGATQDTARQLRSGLATIEQIKKKSIRAFEKDKNGFELIIEEFSSVALVLLIALLIEIFNVSLIGLNLALNSETAEEKAANTPPPTPEEPQQPVQAPVMPQPTQRDANHPYIVKGGFPNE